MKQFFRVSRIIYYGDKSKPLIEARIICTAETVRYAGQIRNWMNAELFRRREREHAICLSRQPHGEKVQCELRKGHSGDIHLSGEYCWPTSSGAALSGERA